MVGTLPGSGRGVYRSVHGAYQRCRYQACKHLVVRTFHIHCCGRLYIGTFAGLLKRKFLVRRPALRFFAEFSAVNALVARPSDRQGQPNG
jgi:hypothetical protein